MDEPSADAVEVSIDGKRVTQTPVAAERGMRWTLEVPPGAAGLEVRRRDSGDDEAFSLALRTLEQSAVDEHNALDTEAGSAFRDGRLEAVAGAVERARLRHHPSVAAHWAHALTFYYISKERDLVRGRRWLDEAGALLPYEDAMHLFYRGLLAETRGDLGEALIANQQALGQTRALGAGLDPLLVLAVLGRTAVLLARTGDREGAAEAIRLGLPLARSNKKIEPLDHAKFLGSAAWSQLILRASSPRPRVLLEEARALLSDEPRGQDAWFTVRINLAYDALERGETSAARRWLDALDEQQLTRANALWHRLLLARLERLEGALEPAHRRLEGMITDAERHRDDGLLWAARVEHARVLEQLGHVPEALAEYAEADLLQERMLLLLSVGDRERFSVHREAVAQRRTQLLLDQGQPEAALCVARLARTRALRSLDQRMRRDTDPQTRRALDEYLSTRLRLDAAYDETFWIASAARAQRRRQEIDRERETNTKRFETIMRGTGHQQTMHASCDGLPRPAPGTVDLHYVQLEDSWVGFIVDDDSVTPRELPDLSAALDANDSARLGAALLGPFEDPLTEASRVRVMATGPLFGVAFHALPLGPDGRRLQDGRTVVHGIDLPRVLATSDASGPALVLEPPSNLVRAHEEAELTASALSRRGDIVLALGDQDEADEEGPLAARLLVELPRASWLHYVGHARSDGLGGWDSELVLAADGTAVFGVQDVLALPAVPPVVILSGCQTGVVDPRSHGGGMSLAHAFMLSGSQVVIATTEEVRDDEALALMRDLYDTLDDLDAAAVPRAMAEAQRRAAATEQGEHEQGTPRAWRSARTWVP